MKGYEPITLSTKYGEYEISFYNDRDNPSRKIYTLVYHDYGTDRAYMKEYSHPGEAFNDILNDVIREQIKRGEI